MILKIWGRTNSANVKKALWCAEELGLAYERIDAGGVFGVVDEPAFRALNPNGLVPVLEDGDLVLWESNTIVRYLAAKYGAGHLRLDNPATQASAEKWMDWTLGTVVRPFSDVFWGLVRTPPAERDPAKIAAGLEACNRALAIADAALAVRRWLSGAGCPATISVSATFRSASSSMAGSAWRSSGRSSPPSRPGTNA